jgi:diguanylate cyclase (GGDEF)-like protein/PAS domain S-box-containing protein
MAIKRLPSPYTIGFVLLMLIAAGEALLLASLVGQLRTDASLSNVGGPQRMRTQRIAFLAEEAVERGLTPQERSEFVAAIVKIRASQRELDDDSTIRIGTPSGNGSTDLEIAVDRYAAAAADVLAHPKTSQSANAYLLAHRLPLLLALDRAVEAHKTASEARKGLLWAAVIALLAIMAAIVVATWRFVVVPLERHYAKSRDQLRTLFEDHPEAVTTYALNGRIVNANAAALALFGPRSGARGERTFAASVVPELRSEADLAFARSASGDPTKLETTVERDDGRRVEVSESLLPSVVNGRIDGVYVIARDVTQERRAERELKEQAQRIRDLYLVAATAAQSAEAQTLAALELGCNRIGLEWGFVAHVDEGIATITASVGRGPYGAGDHIRIGKSIVRKAMSTHDIVQVKDFADEPVVSEAADQLGRLTSFVTFPIEIEGISVAAVCFASMLPKTSPLTESDRDFIRLIGALIGAAIERGEDKRRLAAMAFADPLTGLPNRTSLDASIEDLIGRARRCDDRFAVHFIDLDGFKRINDERGHAVGDELLRVVGARIRAAVTPLDIAARLGGDEFIVLQPEAKRPEEANALAARLIEAITEPITINDERVAIGASIGIASYPQDGTDVKTLFGNADRALYHAKSSGRGRYESATVATADRG